MVFWWVFFYFFKVFNILILTFFTITGMPTLCTAIVVKRQLFTVYVFCNRTSLNNNNNLTGSVIYKCKQTK